MNRRLAWIALALAFLAATVGGLVQAATTLSAPLPYIDDDLLRVGVVKALFALAFVLGGYGLYDLAVRALVEHAASKRRAHDVRNVLRLAIGALTIVAVLGVVTEQWVGVLLSLGVVGFGITFALQQPLLSFLGWIYIMVKRPYSVGDRVKIDDSNGDVIEVDFLVTTLWEINGDLVSSNQPSGRVVTVPNSVVLSSQVINYGTLFEHVWNELTIQVAYETDLDLAIEVMVEEADALLGDEMAASIGRYRRQLASTAVELDVTDRPSVNVVQTESWVELRLRYLVNPRRGTRTRNELYRRILRRFNDHPDDVRFPIGRNR